MTENMTKFRVGSQAISAATTAEQLPGLSIPNGLSIVIKARDTNTNYIYIGHSKATAEAHHFELAPGESVEIFTDNLNDVWIDVTVNGEYVEWLTEVQYGEP